MTGRLVWLSVVGIFKLLLVSDAWSGEVFVVAAGNNVGLPDEQALRFAESDAATVEGILARLGKVRPENAVLLLDADADALRLALNAVEARIALLEQKGIDTTLLFFFSGHADVRGLHLRGGIVNFEELRGRFTSSKARFRVMVLDACRSGGLTVVKGARQIEPKALSVTTLDVIPEGLAIITSSAAGEASYESEDLSGSFFSFHFAAALRGAADANRDNRVTLAEAYNYTYQQTLRSSGRTIGLQHPTFRFEMKGKGDVVLTTLDGDARRSGILMLDAPGYYLVMEKRENGRIVAEMMVGEGIPTLALPAGKYFVQKRAARFYREFQLELLAGQRLLLSSLSYRSVEYARLLRKGGGDRFAVPGVGLYAGARQGLLEGETLAPILVAAFSVDLSFLSFELIVGGSRAWMNPPNEVEQVVRDQVFAGLNASRFFDFDALSVSAGLQVEGAYHHQTFETSGVAPDISSYSLGFGPMFTAERKIARGLAIGLRVGVVTNLFPESRISAGVVVGEQLSWKVTGQVLLGVQWRM